MMNGEKGIYIFLSLTIRWTMDDVNEGDVMRWMSRATTGVRDATASTSVVASTRMRSRHTTNGRANARYLAFAFMSFVVAFIAFGASR